uniref:Uncharacterized protein n=1 Tax=Arundo donax TaxID=35708 RepID=A0A0A9D1N5_ARUDO
MRADYRYTHIFCYNFASRKDTIQEYSVLSKETIALIYAYHSCHVCSV